MINALFITLASTVMFIRWGLLQDQHTNCNHECEYDHASGYNALFWGGCGQETAEVNIFNARINEKPCEQLA